MNKTEFIQTLETTLINANLEVTALSLINDNTVQITFKGNGTRKVDITADSRAAIILDVMKHVFWLQKREENHYEERNKNII